MDINNMSDHIVLKWGVLKGWKFDSEQSRELVSRYMDAGSSFSAMTQQNTPAHKRILCELIKQHDGSITNDWSGEKYTKEQAIDYVMNYDKD
jgi:hypothetical protein